MTMTIHMNTYFFPKNMTESKLTCLSICKQFGVDISFDNKWKNYLPGEYNRAASGQDIDCAFYQDWNYDLLVFAVLHELGHIVGYKEDELNDKKNKFSHELLAWHWAINQHIKLFGRNISIRQGRYMMEQMGTYLPNYNDSTTDWTDKDVISEREGSFWCPIEGKTLK